MTEAGCGAGWRCPACRRIRTRQQSGYSARTLAIRGNSVRAVLICIKEVGSIGVRSGLAVGSEAGGGHGTAAGRQLITKKALGLLWTSWAWTFVRVTVSPLPR